MGIENPSGNRMSAVRPLGKKGNQRHFGMKMHMGSDAETGLAHGGERVGRGA